MKAMILIPLALGLLLAWSLLGRAFPDDQPPPTQVHTVDTRGAVGWEPPTSSTTTAAPVVAADRNPQRTTAPTHRCGGDLPPCSVMMRESRGDIHAYNPTGCGGRGCRGKWQCDPRTCTGAGTEAEQDAEARAIWDDGRGCAHWAACS